MSAGVARSSGLQLDDDVVELVVPGEGADPPAAEQGLQRRRDVADRDARGPRPGPGRSATVSSGLLTRRSVSTFTSPWICRARVTKVSIAGTQRARSRDSATTNWTGLPNPPKAGGLLAKASTPGTAEELRLHLADDLLHRPVPLASSPLSLVNSDAVPGRSTAAEAHDAEVPLRPPASGHDLLDLLLVPVGVVAGTSPPGRHDEGDETTPGPPAGRIPA